jgi:serine/threonine protein kinase/WD40 repeat protein
MTPERRERMWAVFDGAAELPPGERGAFLDAACRGDPGLRAEVESLLAHDPARPDGGADDTFLKSPLFRSSEYPPTAPLQGDSADGPAPPQRIGHYRVVRTLGAGGMGTVYEAEQDNPRRAVALKVIRKGFASPGIVKRFIHEAQVLGRLQHPGIAQIYEAGLAGDGQPFFAMELIRGLPLNEYAQKHRLDPHARLRLLARVCDAVQHAHEKGVVHRDLKPGNVLVNDAGQPKVLDFGVARVTDAGPQTATARTEIGQLIGTLSYMSPEQVTADPAALDSRSDVYTLGVLLFELLADRLPYHLEHLPLPEVARVILERDPPRLGSVNTRFRGDVETIAAKALEKDRSKRYPSAGELAADIRRHLNHEPIRARRTSPAELLVRWGRRNKPLAAALAVSALFLVLITAVAIAAALYFREQEGLQRTLAKEKTDLAERNEQLAVEKHAALLEAEATLVDLQTSRGLLAGERDDAALAVLWFARAAGQAASDPQRQADNRLRARNWVRDAVLPVGVLSLSQGPRRIAFRPGDDLLLVQEGMRLVLWDWRQDKVLDWPDGTLRVDTACWSSDGAYLAAGLASGEVQIYKAPDGAVVQSFKNPGPITALAYSPDGRYLAVAGTAVRLWDVRAGALLPAIWQHPQAVDAAAFNAKGDRLVTACRDGKARVYAVPGAADRPGPLFPPVSHLANIPSAPAFIDNDTGLVTITGDRQLTWWDAESGKPVPSGVLPTTPYQLSRVVASPRGDWFAAGGVNEVQVWSATPGGGKSVVLPHFNRVMDLAFSPDGTTLLSVGWDQTARLWSLPEGRALGPPLAHLGSVRLCAFSGDQAHLATAQLDGHVRVWKRPASGLVLAEVKDWGAPLGARPRVSFDDRLVAPGYWHEMPHNHAGMKGLVVLDARTGKPAGPEIRVPGTLFDSCVCADGRSVAAVSVDGEAGWLSLWDVTTGRALFEPRKLSERPLSVAARPQGRQVAVLGEGGVLLVFDARNGERVFELCHEGWLRAGAANPYPRVEFTADGATLVSLCCRGNTLDVWDAETGRLRFPPVRPALQDGPCRSFALSADGRLLATAVNGKNAAQVWDLATGRAVSGPLLHPGDSYGLFHLAFSPDGRLLITASKDGQARVWDWRGGKLACPPLRHQDEVYAVALTADGRYAVTGGRLGAKALHVWELKTGKIVAPPLPLSAAVTALSISPDGKALVGTGNSSAALIDLPELLASPEMSAEDFGLLAELATAQQIELGDVSGLTPEQWLERWRRLRRKHPAFGQ